MAVKDKILAELKKHLGTTFPDVYERYEKKFSSMSEQEIKDWFIKKNGRVRLYAEDSKLEQSNVDKICKSTGVVLE